MSNKSSYTTNTHFTPRSHRSLETIEEFCKRHGIPHRDRTEERLGQYSVIFSGPRKNETSRETLKDEKEFSNAK